MSEIGEMQKSFLDMFGNGSPEPEQARLALTEEEKASGWKIFPNGTKVEFVSHDRNGRFWHRAVISDRLGGIKAKPRLKSHGARYKTKNMLHWEIPDSQQAVIEVWTTDSETGLYKKSHFTAVGPAFFHNIPSGTRG